LPDINKAYYGFSALLKEKYPLECALVKRYRRVVDDPCSYAWNVRRFAIVGIV
jgi:hypothetical protein